MHDAESDFGVCADLMELVELILNLDGILVFDD